MSAGPRQTFYHTAMCSECFLDTLPGKRLECYHCGRKYHTQCFAAQGMVSRFEGAKAAREGDAHRDDFMCENCRFVEATGREPSGPADRALLGLDRMLTLDQFHFDSESGAATVKAGVAYFERWGRERGLGDIVPRSKRDLETKSTRPLLWALEDKSQSGVKFSTVKRLKSCIQNHCLRLPGVEPNDLPVSTKEFTHAMNGIMQRLGDEDAQAKVFSTRLLLALDELLERDGERLTGSAKLEVLQARFAVHLYCQAGLRANEGFAVTIRELTESFRNEADVDHPHFYVQGPAQTKENRTSATRVLVAWKTRGNGVLGAGDLAVKVTDALLQAGRLEDSGVFTDERGEPWKMGWFWNTHILPRLQQLQRERAGGLHPNDDLDEYGSNSFRRTWATMAAAPPNRVAGALRDRQGRWRQKAKGRKAQQEMNELYRDPTFEELLSASRDLSSI